MYSELRPSFPDQRNGIGNVVNVYDWNRTSQLPQYPPIHNTFNYHHHGLSTNVSSSSLPPPTNYGYGFQGNVNPCNNFCNPQQMMYENPNSTSFFPGMMASESTDPTNLMTQPFNQNNIISGGPTLSFLNSNDDIFATPTSMTLTEFL